MMRCGGASSEKAPDDEVKAAMSAVKDVLLSKLNSQNSCSADAYEIKNYTTQVVAGLNFEVTFTASSKGDTYRNLWRAKIFRSLPGNNGVQYELKEVGPK